MFPFWDLSMIDARPAVPCELPSTKSYVLRAAARPYTFLVLVIQVPSLSLAT